MAKKKNLVPEELDDLIQKYLTDGVLTEKERSVILRKAAGMGLDTEEIDLYLEAQVQKIQQAADAVTRQRKGKACPYCGASIPQLTEKCPYCGENITPEASEELKEIFDNLETALIDLKEAKEYKRSKATVERYIRKAKMYYGNNPKIQKLLEEVEQEMSQAEKKAKKTAKKQGFISIITNKWVWVLAELVVIGFLLKGYVDANERYEDYYAQQKAHPDYSRWGWEETSATYELIVANKEKASSKENIYILCIVIGIGVVGFTLKLAIDDNKKK